MKIHFVGIGGAGMCGVAKIALTQGHRVSGSELAQRESLNELRDLGAHIFREHKPSNVEGVDLLIHSSAIKLDHVEIQTAVSVGIRVVKRSKGLGELLRSSGKQIISIAGAHGKSTTTTMVGRMLEEDGRDPEVFVGAFVPYFKSNVRTGSGNHVVVEACEFDCSFLDLKGSLALVTSIAPDHLDYYTGGLSEIIGAFTEFANAVDKSDGVLVACADNGIVQEELLRQYHGPLRTYGLENGMWRAKLISQIGSAQKFQVIAEGKIFGEFTLAVPGIHNVQNAVGAIALADFLGVQPHSMDLALKNYSGIRRRYEKRLVAKDCVIIDDYGHTPTEIACVIKAARQDYPEATIICIPCLRQFHRTRLRLAEFAFEFANSNSCVVAPIVTGLGDDDDSRRSVSSDDLANAIRDHGCPSFAVYESTSLADAVVKMVRNVPNRQTVIITIGSGESESILTELIRLQSL
ncbi:MAG: UDP-N-acetylmuramate--L-alanine ligase [Candidatus Taylorbacteria bacterium RIFCSPLOWO2_02_FULL_43_11]|uniref:UDP-N-acetylmuramate--L-alanine ligase n=1 Tax=Candidatus Taylorbacteria bacterium RIFCSPHIGHO2_02_FULL_43_32b TaxID=1802306 RepID=A0A1G2MGS7_9BACT|nr:MAG: UDP-N-acetylmuramate--L-alanine ligase [Candidatus Taylorbacteria bacterium RIFCSPHIGHO2_01_FULL_43_47]OHA23078.1 MAG: UDP-N-acetylmuramate--L-alanine ligase [Candidatus Taylorbacteria bacterium RIFCSPHIGHO2_02_FULL_43_32b]OHA29955.1 MAG: UDP-N-acetylmuramate--L-alanine ligase [Candidatus Taylorbacteria bacterium RIFCSPLOWO2_01_FULL_43_44]OHA36560.1 MAG: UDP-N-acetylmuramate--L-alanine ligase [Candidatus Taylorbacteria bacterium RIFCSPLOWO2_02_FULL_43_11]